MPTTEKHGGFWYDDEGYGTLVFELYDEGLDLIGTVYEKKHGYFVAQLHEIDRNYTGDFRLPFWNTIRPEALFDDKKEAVLHVEALLLARRKGSLPPDGPAAAGDSEGREE